MVFGWGRKKAERPEYRQREAVSIQMSEIPQVADGLLDLRRAQAVEGIRSCRDKAAPLLGELSHIGRQLERDNLKIDDADRHIQAVVRRGKKQVVDLIKDTADLPGVETYDDAVLMSSMLGQTLKKIGDALGRQTRIIHIFAKRYATKIKDLMAELKSVSEEARAILENFDESAAASKEIAGLIGDVQKIRTLNSDAARRLSMLGGEHSACQDRTASCARSILEIKSSAEYSRLVDARNAIGELEQEKARLAGLVLDQFTMISRPLGRYEHASSHDKEQRALLSRLIRSPFDVLAGGEKDAVVTILENVKRGILSGSISVKDTKKSISHIARIGGMLDGLASEIGGLAAQQAAAERTIAELTPAELGTLEKRLAKLALEKSSIESRMRSLREEVAANESRVPQIISDMESRLRKFSNTRYKIT